MGNNLFFCLGCLDKKREPSVHTSTINHAINFPKSQYEIDPHFVKEEEHKTSVFISFNINSEENLNKTLSFYSLPHEKSMIKSIKEEQNSRNSNFLRNSSLFRTSNLFESFFLLISSLYEGFELLFSDEKSSMKLKIYLKSYMKNKSRINIFRTEFFAPSSSQEFFEFSNNIELQKTLDTTAEKYHILKKLNEKNEILYLSYKKTIITSPRDFVYLKTYGEFMKNNRSFYCIVGKSVEFEEFPCVENTIRCEILNSGYLIENKEEGCFIKTYSEFDFKINVPLFIVKNFSVGESRKFVENSIKKLKEVSKK